MTAWLIGLLVGVAALGLGYAAVDATLGVVALGVRPGAGERPGGTAPRRAASLPATRDG